MVGMIYTCAAVYRLVPLQGGAGHARDLAGVGVAGDAGAALAVVAPQGHDDQHHDGHQGHSQSVDNNALLLPVGVLLPEIIRSLNLIGVRIYAVSDRKITFTVNMDLCRHHVRTIFIQKVYFIYRGIV